MLRGTGIVSVVLFLVLLFAGSSEGVNHHEFEDLNDIMDIGDEIGVPVLIFGNDLHLSLAFSNDVLTLQMPIVAVDDGSSGHQHDFSQVEISTTTIQSVDVSGEWDDKAFIRLLAPSDTSPIEADGLVLGTTPDIEHPGISIISTSPEKVAKGRLLILPLINFPEGTEGYVMPLMEFEGNWIIPLIQMPRGHLANHHSLENEWGLQYDMAVTLNYELVRP